PRRGWFGPALSRVFSWQQLVAALLVLAILFGAVDNVSAQSLPGDPLYSWKRTHEELAVTLEPDPEARAALYLTYMQRRLREIDTLVASDQPAKAQLIDETLSTLLTHASEAVHQAKQANDTGIQQQVSQQL